MKTVSSAAVVSLMVVLASGLAAQDQSLATQDHGAAAVNAQPSDTTSLKPLPQAGVVEASSIPKESDGAMPGDSHVRIVRLSQAQGKMGLDRGTGKVEATMQNMPIVEHSRLATSDGYAEIEFEDGSTLRVAPESQVNFPQLILRSNGVKASTIQLVKGTAYMNLEKTKDNEFTVKAGDAIMKVAPGTHLRLELDGKKAVLAVFKGDVETNLGTASAMVSKKHTATLEDTTASTAGKIDVTKDIEEADYDEWDKDSQNYHNRYAQTKPYGNSLYSYGISDLNYYGGFVNAGGCGSMWRPYLASSAWDPYGNGVWAWYQGAGYSWVSPYPWGWLPYHSGAWSFCPGVGWGWRPGSAWLGLANGSPIMQGRPIPAKPEVPGQGIARGGSPLRPPGPERPTGVPHSTLLLSNRTPLVSSKMDRPGNFVFQRDSAGVGVPRGAMGSLRGISNHVERNGFANRQVYAQPSMSAGGAERGAAMSSRSAALNENRSSGFNHQQGLNAQSFRRGPDGQGAFQGNAAAAAFRQSQSGNAGASGGFHNAGPASSGSTNGGFHGGGGSSAAANGSMGGGSFRGGGGGGGAASGSSSGSSGGATHR